MPCWLTVVVLAVVLVVLGACSNPAPLATVAPTVAPPTVTVAPPPPSPSPLPATVSVGATSTPNATIAFQEFKAGYPRGAFSNPTNVAIATQVAAARIVYETAIALTPIDTPVPWTPAPPGPTPTWFVGMLTDTGCIIPDYTGAPQFASCWRTQVNGTWFFVAGGFAGDPHSPPDNSVEGLLLVCVEPCRAIPSESALYPVPRQVGDVHIVAVDGLRVTLEPRLPQYHDRFVFDLGTRQWVGLTPTPP
ncbi:MAG TPA: hypothetical protein VKY74_06420 [Chloroflexia bacterium]|nr:hypothetical protein [Chloroflexia bacterium]